MDNFDVEIMYYTERIPVKHENGDVKLDENGNKITKPCQDLKYAKRGDACVDIRALEGFSIKPRERVTVRTGLYVAIPENWELQIRPRSGISFTTDIIFKNTIGTIDSGYKKEIGISLFNLSNTNTYYFEQGDRIAQMKAERVPIVKYTNVDSVDILLQHGYDRGDGLGSTKLK